ncbi:MAG: YbjN domain-containing protein [Myxococcales bacterium]|nr:YbjN domain-containing protein [Myxococcales bacterium]
MNADKLETYIRQMDVPHEPLPEEGSWVLAPQGLHQSRIIVKISDPIVLFTTPIFKLSEATQDREHLFRRLLELNEDLLHCAYGLDGDQILLSGAHPLENLDYNEFQAMIDDMSMGLDRHLDQLAPWCAPEGPTSAQEEA